MARVLIRQGKEREVAILREQEQSSVHQCLAALRRPTPARARDLDVTARIREGREPR